MSGVCGDEALELIEQSPDVPAGRSLIVIAQSSQRIRRLALAALVLVGAAALFLLLGDSAHGQGTVDMQAARQSFFDLAEARASGLGDSPYAIAPQAAMRALAVPESKLDKHAMAGVQCAVDVTMIVTILGYAVDFIWQAASASSDLKCLGSSQEGCAVAINAVIMSFGWIASALSSSVTSCAPAGTALIPGAACASDVTGIIAALAGFASAASGVGSSCNPQNLKPPADRVEMAADIKEQMANATLPPTLPPSKRASLRDILNSMQVARMINEPDSLSAARNATQQNEQMQWAKAQCAFDVPLAAAMLMRGGQRIAAATEDCADPMNCAIDALVIVSSFSWAANALAMAASDCGEVGNSFALCTADIGLFGATTTATAALTMAATADCAGD